MNTVNADIYKEKYHSKGVIKIVDQHFAQRNGDIIYIFYCVSKIAKIDTKENCYDHILVEGDWYVNPQTKITTRNTARLKD